VAVALVTPRASNAQSAEQCFLRARQLAEQGKLEEAKREYQLAIKLAPGSAAAHNNLGAIYFAQQDLKAAISAFKEAHRLQPANPEYSFNLGLALYQSNNCEAAMPSLAAGAAAPGRWVHAHYLLGDCYFALKQWQRSITELEQARKQQPDNGEILFLLAEVYRKVGNHTQSLEAATQLVEKHPDSLLANELLGENYDAGGRPNQAEQEFKRAIAASPNAPGVHFSLGYLYWRWKRYAEAVAPLKEEIRINPTFGPSYFCLGDILLKEEKPRDAAGYLKRASELDPSSGLAYLGLGEVYVQLGQPREAIPFFRRAVELSPDQVQPHYWLGKTLIRIGKAEEGKRELAEVARIHANLEQQARDNLRQAMAPAKIDSAPAPP
jgi:tetratricopeptide (TPR) repeat protein